MWCSLLHAFYLWLLLINGNHQKDGSITHDVQGNFVRATSYWVGTFCVTARRVPSPHCGPAGRDISVFIYCGGAFPALRLHVCVREWVWVGELSPVQRPGSRARGRRTWLPRGRSVPARRTGASILCARLGCASAKWRTEQACFVFVELGFARWMGKVGWGWPAHRGSWSLGKP